MSFVYPPEPSQAESFSIPMSRGSFKYEEMVALASYCFSSLTITLLNKAVLSSNQFKMNFLLLAVQAVTSVALLVVFQSAGSIKYKPIRKAESIKCKFVGDEATCVNGVNAL